MGLRNATCKHIAASIQESLRCAHQAISVIFLFQLWNSKVPRFFPRHLRFLVGPGGPHVGDPRIRSGTFRRRVRRPLQRCRCRSTAPSPRIACPRRKRASTCCCWVESDRPVGFPLGAAVGERSWEQMAVGSVALECLWMGQMG